MGQTTAGELGGELTQGAWGPWDSHSEPSLLRSLEQDRKTLSSWAWGPFYGLSPTPPRSEVPEPTLEALKDRAGRGHSPLVISRNSVRDPTRRPLLYLQPVREVQRAPAPSTKEGVWLHQGNPSQFCF